MSDLEQPLRSLVGEKTAKALSSGLRLETVADLLRHYPRRYVSRGELTPLKDLTLDEHVTVLAEVAAVSSRVTTPQRGPSARRRSVLTEVTVTDGRDKLRLTFFNQAWRERELTVGTTGLFSGKVTAFRGQRQLTHPDYQVMEDDGDPLTAEAYAAELIPVYPATAAMASWRIAQCVRLALDLLVDLDDPMPDEVRERQQLLGLREAYWMIHRPASRAAAAQARDRLRWDEAFLLQVVLAEMRAAARALRAVPRVPRPGGLLDAFDARLPFALTAGQRAVGEELLHDLARTYPMHRLLQGEVGSGKTVCALRAMLTVVDSGGQAALLAPTEVLAQQHHRTITAMLGSLAERGLLGGSETGSQVALLTGSSSTASRRRALLDAASGDAGIVVGTHALLEDRVEFYDLGLVVVDEQHRFGVEQRDALRAKADCPPHVLVMTATPIPRTVAMTVFGDLEVSTLAELPGGRSPIQSSVVPAGERPAWLDRAWARLREEVAAGHQAYVVCPRIGADGGPDDPPGTEDVGADSGAGSAAGAPAGDGAARRPPLAVLDVLPLISEGPLDGLRVEALHGRLAPDVKDDVMRRFTRGDIDVLVATTVVEVGVDVPNATVMVVLDADRFGVSQLHQLRGRVGRGAAPGLCLLVTEMPEATAARERLDAVAATLDGFELSRLDLEQRREGDVLGASQSGSRSSLRLLSVVRDEPVIAAAREEATALVRADPELAGHPLLRAAVARVADDERAEYLEKG